MDTKKCCKCKTVKDLVQFNKNKSKKDGFSNYCKACKKLYEQVYYETHKQINFARAKSHREKRRQEIKQDLKCAQCGESHPACLVFHHIDPTQKEYTIGYMLNRSYSLDRINVEIAKCIVLCANCHSKLHYG